MTNPESEAMKPELLIELLLEIEQEDPLDYTGLPFDPDDLRQLACLNVADIMNKLPAGSSQEDNALLMAATVARLVLENMVLQARLAILLQE